MSNSGLWTPGQSKSATPEIPDMLSIADQRIKIDTIENVVSVDGKPLESMETKVIRVLATLSIQPDKLITFSELSQNVWENSNYDKNDWSQRVAIKKLRKKLGPELGDADTGAIRNVVKLGYLAVSSLNDNRRIHNIREKFPSLKIADNRIETFPDSHLVTVDNEILDKLTEKEFEVLAYLSERPDQLITKSELSEVIWRHPDFHKTSVSPRKTINNLRRKLGLELGDTIKGVIRTRIGLGYIAMKSLKGHTQPT